MNTETNANRALERIRYHVDILFGQQGLLCVYCEDSNFMWLEITGIQFSFSENENANSIDKKAKKAAQQILSYAMSAIQFDLWKAFTYFFVSRKEDPRKILTYFCSFGESTVRVFACFK